MRLLYQYTTFMPPVNYFDKKISLFYILFHVLKRIWLFMPYFHY